MDTQNTVLVNWKKNSRNHQNCSKKKIVGKTIKSINDIRYSQKVQHTYMLCPKEEKRKKMSRIVKEIMAENFPVMKKSVTSSFEMLEDEEEFRY